MSNYLFRTSKSILFLASPLLVFETLSNIRLTPNALVFQYALLVWVIDFILTFV